MIAAASVGALMAPAVNGMRREPPAGREPGTQAPPAEQASPAERPIPIGVMGDSDSHAYQDRVWFAPGTPERGGAYRAATLQWTEVLARLRGDQLDPGPWGTWGTGRTLARLRGWVGLPAETPKKQDYRYNVAYSGAGCADLMEGSRAQAPRLAALMDREPGRWRNGVVVIRIGINSLGSAAALEQLARDPASPAVLDATARCVGHIEAAVALLRERHPLTRIVLIGILDNADWPPFFDRWQSRRELANITAGLDRFDRSLKQLAAAHPRMAFFDDRAWFARHWGSRDQDGRPDYRVVSVGAAIRVVHASADHPSHSVLGDGHAGLVWNALWAQSLVQLLDDAFGMGVTPIADDEIARFLQARMPAGR